MQTGNPNTKESEQPETVLNIIRKEFFDITGHDKDDELKQSPFYSLSKSAVLQECRAFNDPNVVTAKPDLCRLLMSKVLYLLVVEGEELTPAEGTEVFFGATKLFQSQDPNLRRMTYLFIKEIAERMTLDDFIMVVGMLVKDVNSENELFRVNSLYVLSRVLDSSLLMQMERYIKQAIVHKNPLVASSALLCGLYLYNVNPDAIRRWVSEINQSLNYEDEMVQYHGLLLLHAMKRNDRLAMNKLLDQLRSKLPSSPLAICMLIRYSVQLLREDPNSDAASSIYEMLTKCLRHSNDMVCFEAARALIALPDVREEDLGPAVNMLQISLGSSRSVSKFAAVRILNELSVSHPAVVEACNADLELLVNDANRSVATLAVSTLLKTVGSDRIDSLLKQISSYMGEIDDEFKQVLVRALFDLSAKYPDQYSTILSFLSTILRGECSEALSTAIVDTVLSILRSIPEALEASLLHLCECIEDCEYPQVIVRILFILSQYGPKAVAPARFIRFIYNRIILEGPAVRAAAVQALGVFAGKVPAVRSSVLELLQGCLKDEDGEVRERAVTAMIGLQKDSETLLLTKLPLAPAQLRASLCAYQTHPAEGPLDYQHLTVVEVQQPREAKKEAKEEVQATPAIPTSSLYDIPAFAGFGKLIRSSRAEKLTESETEYVVTLTKHVFPGHVVLQFAVQNTVEGQVMTDVAVRLQLEEGDAECWKAVAQIPAGVIACNEEKNCYVALEFAAEGEVPEAGFQATLVFQAKDVDEDEMDQLDEIEGFNEEYAVEAFTIDFADFVSRPIITDYRAMWTELAEHEVVESVSLSFEDIETAVKEIVNVIGLHVFEGTDRVAAGSTNHTLMLAGKVMDEDLVMARGQVVLSQKYGCVLKIAVRSEKPELIQTVISLLQ